MKFFQKYFFSKQIYSKQLLLISFAYIKALLKKQVTVEVSCTK